MKKSFLVNTLIITLFTGSFFALDNKKIATCATGDSSIEIGTLCGISEIVSTTTKVIIPGLYESYIENITGRTVYNELVYVSGPGDGGGVPFIPPTGGVVSPQDIGHYEIQYYYYATPTEPKLNLHFYEMRNDTQSLIRGIRYLEDLAELYGLTTKKDINNAVLGYIRCMNSSYNATSNNDPWYIVAGDKNIGFINFVQSLNPGGLRISEYFASFVSSDRYNSNTYGSISSQYFNANYTLIDPVSNEEKIDLIHMIASMDAIFDNSERQNTLVELFVQDEVLQNNASWAGDLQTEIRRLGAINGFDYTDLDTFEDVMALPNTLFSAEDFYADVDAVNIATNVDLANSNYYVSDYVYTYYNSLTDNIRFSNFYDNLAVLSLSGSSVNSEKVAYSIYRAAKTTVNGGDFVLPNYLFPDINTNVKKANYGLLYYSNGDYPDLGLRYYVATLFLDYVVGLAFPND